MCLLELGNMSDLYGKSARNKILKYSKETIYHFNCSVCKNWWSYAHTEIKPERRSSLKQYEMAIAGNYCPHCGTLYETLEEINVSN